jgi:GT2 family glycosyltransferase
LWETCNLLVRRRAVDRGGLFDEEWNPTGKPDQHFGEDAEWGWRLIRHGATYAFEPAAEVEHATLAVSYGEWLEYALKVRYLPLAVRSMPEIRRRFHRGVFLTRRHMLLTAAAGLAAGSAVAGVAGARRTAAVLGAAAAVPAFSPWRFHVLAALEHSQREVIDFAALVYGSVRYRRLVL